MASDSPSLDLSHLPLTFLLPTHLSSSQALHSEAQLRSCKCPLAPSISTASLFLADINTPKRAAFELRGRGLKTTYLSSSSSEPPIRVVKLAWFNLSLSAGKLLPIEEYTVYTAVRTAVVPLIEPKTLQSKKATADEELRKEILERARRDAVRNREEDKRHGNHYLRFERHGKDELVDLSMRQRRGIGEIMELSGAGEVGHRRSGTPEFEDKRQARTAEDMPEWVKKNVRILRISCDVMVHRLLIFMCHCFTVVSSCFLNKERNPLQFLNHDTALTSPHRGNTHAAARPSPTPPMPSLFATSTPSVSRVLFPPPLSVCKPTPP